MKKLRKAADITQSELGDMIRYGDRADIERIETGKAACPKWVAEAIAKALSSTTGKLFKKDKETGWYRVK